MLLLLPDVVAHSIWFFGHGSGRVFVCARSDGWFLAVSAMREYRKQNSFFFWLSFVFYFFLFVEKLQNVQD